MVRILAARIAMVASLSERLPSNAPGGDCHQSTQNNGFESGLEAVAEDLDWVAHSRLIEINKQRREYVKQDDDDVDIDET